MTTRPTVPEQVWAIPRLSRAGPPRSRKRRATAAGAARRAIMAGRPLAYGLGEARPWCRCRRASRWSVGFAQPGPVDFAARARLSAQALR